MCGIFGVINNQSVTNSLVSGLEALSYRGYDSAGIALISEHGLERRRAMGKIPSLKEVLKLNPLEGTIGIAHTRWATHGAPTECNAHPHMTTRVAVVHNGIIENFQVLRESLEDDGYQFESETDSETIPLLITRCLDQGMDHMQALNHSLSCLEGSFAIAAVFKNLPNDLFAARRGSPLVIGKTDGGFYLASDLNALRSISQSVCYLEDGDLACINRNKLEIYNGVGQSVERCMTCITTNEAKCDKQGYRHYMQKEIHEQPYVFQKTIESYLNSSATKIELPVHSIKFEHINRLSIIACGTSHYAGMISKYWIESLAGLPVDIDIASEYRYRHSPVDKHSAALFISQSGETADTYAALKHARNSGLPCLSIVNVADSTIAHESDDVLPTLAGNEIGVASTKAFTSQLAVFLMITLDIARINHQITLKEQSILLEKILHFPKMMRDFLRNELPIRRIASKLKDANNMLYLGRGIAFPLALEGALKLKEISYIHAEAYPAGELKHGPIALVDDKMPIVIIAPPGELFAKTLSNLREVSARGARVFLISNAAGVKEAGKYIEDAIVMPEVDDLLMPVLYTLPLQLLAYHVAILKGTDIDQPRNLAKSVTVE